MLLNRMTGSFPEGEAPIAGAQTCMELSMNPVSIIRASLSRTYIPRGKTSMVSVHAPRSPDTLLLASVPVQG